MPKFRLNPIAAVKARWARRKSVQRRYFATKANAIAKSSSLLDLNNAYAEVCERGFNRTEFLNDVITAVTERMEIETGLMKANQEAMGSLRSVGRAMIRGKTNDSEYLLSKLEKARKPASNLL